MQNAPPYGSVYLQDLALDPERVHDYLFGQLSYVSAPRIPLTPPPPGEIRLVLPLTTPDDPDVAEARQRAWNWLRVQLQKLILESDGRALAKQARQFSLFTRMLMWQRGFDGFMTRPHGPVWGRKFASREVIATAVHLYERHGDVRLRIDMATGRFDLCTPNVRIRQRSDEVHVSLLPVVDALLMEGLWVDRPDERFCGLARVMVQLGREEQRRVGRTRFITRSERGEQ